jgi:hypothetical protein
MHAALVNFHCRPIRRAVSVSGHLPSTTTTLAETIFSPVILANVVGAGADQVDHAHEFYIRTLMHTHSQLATTILALYMHGFPHEQHRDPTVAAAYLAASTPVQWAELVQSPSGVPAGVWPPRVGMTDMTCPLVLNPWTGTYHTYSQVALPLLQSAEPPRAIDATAAEFVLRNIGIVAAVVLDLWQHLLQLILHCDTATAHVFYQRYMFFLADIQLTRHTEAS